MNTNVPVMDCLTGDTTDGDSPFCAERLGHSDTDSPEAQRPRRSR